VTGEKCTETDPFGDLLRRAQQERASPWESIAALRKTALAGGYVLDLERQ
jgi:hypothetical protein